MPVPGLRAKLWGYVENRPHHVVLFCAALSLALIAILCWRAAGILNDRHLAQVRHELDRTKVAVTAFMEQELRRVQTLRQVAEESLQSRQGSDATAPDSQLQAAYAGRNQPTWQLPLSAGGPVAVGFGPTELARLPAYLRNDETLLADLAAARTVGRLLQITAGNLEFEAAGRFVSRNGFYIGVPQDTIAPHRGLERFAGMPLYRDTMPDRNPQRHVVRTPVYVGLARPELRFAVSAPVYLGNDFRGAVVLEISQRMLRRALGETVPGPGKRILAARNGEVIAISEPGMAPGQQWPRDFGGTWRNESAADLWARGEGTLRRAGQHLLFRRVGSTDLLLVEEISDAQLVAALFRDLRWPLVGVVVSIGLLLWASLAVISRLFARLIERGEALRALAEHDALTGLANRRAFEHRFRLERDRRHRNPEPLSLVLVDVDHFKRINDTWGHANGDRALVALADACRDGLRTVDLPARFGGEEFALLLPATSLAEASRVAERLRATVAALAVPAIGDEAWPDDDAHRIISFTASFGVAEMGADRVDELEQLVGVADRRLYQAKAMGRNRVVATDVAADDAAVASAPSPTARSSRS